MSDGHAAFGGRLGGIEPSLSRILMVSLLIIVDLDCAACLIAARYADRCHSGNVAGHGHVDVSVGGVRFVASSAAADIIWPDWQ